MVQGCAGSQADLGAKGHTWLQHGRQGAEVGADTRGWCGLMHPQCKALSAAQASGLRFGPGNGCLLGKPVGPCSTMHQGEQLWVTCLGAASRFSGDRQQLVPPQPCLQYPGPQNGAPGIAYPWP